MLNDKIFLHKEEWFKELKLLQTQESLEFHWDSLDFLRVP